MNWSIIRSLSSRPSRFASSSVKMLLWSCERCRVPRLLTIIWDTWKERSQSHILHILDEAKQASLTGMKEWWKVSWKKHTVLNAWNEEQRGVTYLQYVCKMHQRVNQFTVTTITIPFVQKFVQKGPTDNQPIKQFTYFPQCTGAVDVALIATVRPKYNQKASTPSSTNVMM